MAAVIGVTGLAFEARIACGTHTRAICGGDGYGLETSLSHAIAGDARGLISFGIAGGLSPNLQPGTCIVASSIVCGTRRLMTDNAWSCNALRLIPGAIPGTIAGVSGVVAAHPAMKCALHEQTGAIAVDNESHVVARVAAAYDLPMIAVRVIVDPVSREIPASAVAAVRADGSIDLAALGRRIGGAPGELPKLLRIAIDEMTGLLALLRCRRLLGSALGLPSLAESDTNTRPIREITGPTICGLRDECLEAT